MIVVNADDFGLSHEVNLAIRDGIKLGLVDRTTIMMNGPHVREAIAIAFEEGFSDKVGLHLNLTEGKPLTELCKKSRLCLDGKFCNLFYKKNPKARFYLKPKTKRIVKCEIQKQMEAYLEAGFSGMFLDGHHHVHTNISLTKLVLSLADKAGFKTIRVCRNFPGIQENRLKKLYKKWINRGINRFNKKQLYLLQTNDLDTYNLNCPAFPGETEVECHPVYVNHVLMDAGTGKKMEEILAKAQ